MSKIIWVSLVVGVFIFKQENDLNKTQTLNSLLESENRIMRDQIHDMEFTITSSRSYEEGVIDGVNRAKNADWIDGYHAATTQQTQSNGYETASNER